MRRKRAYLDTPADPESHYRRIANWIYLVSWLLPWEWFR